MAQQANHLDNIKIAITLAPVPQTDAKLITALFMRDGITLGGDRVRTYTSLAAVQEDLDASNVDAVVLEVATKVFSQSPSPDQWKVGRYDSGSETLAAAFDLILAEDCEFYHVTTDTRVAADQVAFAEHIRVIGLDRSKFLYFMQSADADWLSAGVPAAYAALVSTSNERAFVLYHSDDAEWNVEAWTGKLSAFDPRLKSYPFDTEVEVLGDITSAPTQVQKDILDANNANHGLAYGRAAYAVDCGVNVLGRPGHEVVTADWYFLELQSRVADAKVRMSNRGRKWPLDQAGADQLGLILSGLNQDGVAFEHFEPGQTFVSVPAPTLADRNAGCLRGSAQATLLGSARCFDFDIEATRNQIFTEA